VDRLIEAPDAGRPHLMMWIRLRAGLCGLCSVPVDSMQPIATAPFRRGFSGRFRMKQGTIRSVVNQGASMVSIIPSKQSDPIGCTIEHDRVRMIQLRSRDRAALGAIASAPIDRGAEANNNEAIAEAIQRALRSAPFQGNDVVAGIGVEALTYRRLLMAPMPDPELEEAVRWRMASELDLDPELHTVDYHDVGSITDSGQQRREVIAVAAPNAGLLRAIECCRGTGLRMTAMDTRFGALSRCLAPLGSPEPILCVCLDASTPFLLVAQGGEPRFVRAIASRSLPISARSASESGEPCMPEELGVLLRHLAAEINRCAYSLNESHGGAFFPRQGCVTGCGSAEERINAALSKSTEVVFGPVLDAVIPEARAALDGRPEGDPVSGWLAPLGLAMYGVEDLIAGAAC